VTIPIRLVLYISYIALILSPPQPPPCTTSCYCKRFTCSISYKSMKSITIYPHHNLLPSPSPSHNYSLPTVPILQSCLSLLIFKLMFKGVSQCRPSVGILYFGPFNPFHYSPLPLYLPPPIFLQFSIYILISSTFTDLMFYSITDALSFSFPFLLSPSSIEQFRYYKRVLAGRVAHMADTCLINVRP
jgi:hypothetical protein